MSDETEVCSQCGMTEDLSRLPSGVVQCRACRAQVQMEVDTPAGQRRRGRTQAEARTLALLQAEASAEAMGPSQGQLCRGPCAAWKERGAFAVGSDVCQACRDAEAEPGPDVAVALGLDGEVSAGGTLVPGQGETWTWIRETARVSTLEGVQAWMRTKIAAEEASIGRAVFGGAALDPSTIPLAVAAEALWLRCYPDLREALTAACDVQGKELWEIIVGVLGYNRQGLQIDESLIADATPYEQYGRGGQRLTVLAGGQRRTLNAQGEIVRWCRCCGVEFVPERTRPNADFCSIEWCGELADLIRRQANNRVMYPQDPQPAIDVYMHLGPEKRRDPARVRQAEAFVQDYMEQKMADAREQRAKMIGR